MRPSRLRSVGKGWNETKVPGSIAFGVLVVDVVEKSVVYFLSSSMSTYMMVSGCEGGFVMKIGTNKIQLVVKSSKNGKI